MKRITKEISILLIMIAIILTMATISKGANTKSFNASATASTTTLKPGEEVTITIGVSNINMGENGINTLEGKIKYDKNIFEEIKSSSVKNLNNWTTTYNDESSTLNGKFLAVNLSSGTKENTQIFNVKFKVKSDIKEAKETQIDFENITSNDGTELVSVGTKSVKLNVKVETPSAPTPEITSKNEIKKKTNTIVDKTQSSTKLPKTGKPIVMIFILILAVIVFAVLLNKNMKMKDIK